MISDADSQVKVPADVDHSSGRRPDDIRAAMARARSQVRTAADLTLRGRDQLYSALAEIALIAQRVINNPVDRDAFWSDPYFANRRCCSDPYLAATSFGLQARTDGQNKTASLWARAIKYQVTVCKRTPDELPGAFRAMRGGLTEAARLYAKFERNRTATQTSAPRSSAAIGSGSRNSGDGESVHLVLGIAPADRHQLEAAGRHVQVTEWSLLAKIGSGKAWIVRVEPCEA